MVFPSYRNPPVVLEPSKEPLDFPTFSVSSKGPAILCFSLLPIGLVRCNQINTQCGQFNVQGITVIGLVTYDPLRKLGQETSFKCLVDQSHFMRRSTVHVEGDRKTRAVCNGHNLGPFAPFSFPNSRPPFLAGEKLPSIKASRMSRPPRSRRSSAKVRRMFSKIPSFDHFWCQRWHVDLEGYRLGRSCHCAPVRSIQSMPLSTSRGFIRGRPRESDRSLADGIKGSNNVHCSFDKSISHMLLILLQKSRLYFGIASR